MTVRYDRPMKLLVVAVLATSSVAAHAKPAIEGMYEVVKAREKGKPEVEVGPAMAQGTRSRWARIIVSFEGSKMSATSQRLKEDSGAFRACLATVSTGLAWTRNGFTVAHDVEGGSTHIAFQQLNASGHDAASSGCSANIKRGTYKILKATGGTVKVEAPDGGELTLAKITSDKPDWVTIFKTTK
jgi:hypothetical protein